MMKKLRQIISLVLVLVMFFDYGAVSASYEPASYAVAAVAGLEELIQSTEPEEIQGEESDAAEAPDLAELPEQPEDAQPGEAPEDAQQSEDPDALLQAERVSPLTGLLNQVSRLSAPYRDDGYIHIYNYYQLSLIGTGLPVEAEDVFHGYADNREADAPEAPDWGEEPEQPAEVEEPEQPVEAEQPEQPAQVEQPEQPAEVEQPEQPAQAEQPEQPAEAEQPEQPAEVEQPEQPAEVEQPEQPAEVEEPEQPAEVEQPEQPAEVEQPEQPAEPEQPEQPTEPDEPEQIAAPEASALPEASQQPGEALLTQVVGRALSRVLVRDTAVSQRAVTATLAAAVAEVTGEEAAPQELAEEDAPAELQGEAQPETDPDPMTDPAQTAAEPALPAAAGESAPADSDTLPTDAEPAPDAVPAQDSEEPEAPAATGTSPTEPDADTDTYYNNDENNEESAPAADPAQADEIAEIMEGEDGEAAPPAAQPELIDDPDVVDSPETGDLSQQPDEPVNEPTDAPDEGTALTESKYYYYPNGELVRYTSDANYYLECDIPLPKENCWTLPEDFTGSFSGRVRPGDAERVYDPETDTVFIQNPKQLEELAAASRERTAQPVMSGDIYVDTFGTGMYLFADGSQGDALLSDDSNPAVTYGGTSNRSLSVGFAVMRKGPSRGGIQNGRSYDGQVTETIDTTTYILIGDRQQLDAINSDSGIKVYGPVYRVRQQFKILGLRYEDDGAPELYYPGDADLIAGATGEALSDWSSAPLYDTANSGLRPTYESLGGNLTGLGVRYLYFMTDDGTPTGNRITSASGLPTYTTDGNYIVFRDIDMRAGDGFNLTSETDFDVLTQTSAFHWQPLMFSGKMYGIKAEGNGQIFTDVLPLINNTGSVIGQINAAGDPDAQDSSSKRPVISYVDVVPYVENSSIYGYRMDYDVHFGIGFFGTIGDPNGFLKKTVGYESKTLDSPSVVKNLQLDHILVETGAPEGTSLNAHDSSTEGLVSVLLRVVGTGLNFLLEIVLNIVQNLNPDGDFNLTLNELLDVTKVDPSGMATGAFAGIIAGNVCVEDCAVSCASVNTTSTAFEQGGGLPYRDGRAIVGKGGFVGQIQGLGVYGGKSPESQNPVVSGLLEGLSQLFNILSLVTDGLAAILNVLSVIGLDLGNVLNLVTHNLLNLGLAVPTDYRSPTVKNCAADRVVLSGEDGKYGVGGFAGSVVGAVVEDSAVTNSDYLVVNADKFGGGFVGVLRDDMVANLLSGLGITFGGGTTNSALEECSILGSDITVTGGGSVGGFAGMMASSHALNCLADANSRLVISADRSVSRESADGSHDNDFVGGFVGHVSVGSNMSAGAHINNGTDLLSTLVGLLTNLLGNNGSALLDFSISNSHSGIMGCQLLGATEVSGADSYVGGLIGFGEAPYVTASTLDNIKRLRMYSVAGTSPVSEARCNVVWNLVDVQAGKDFAGGVAGQLSFASGAGLLGDTLGVGRMAEFILTDTTVRGISLADYRSYYSGTRTDGNARCTEHESRFNAYLSKSRHVVSVFHNYEGYKVSATDYVGGGLGLARGGDVIDVAVRNVNEVKGRTFVGGFVGATGPGDLLGGNGLSLRLLGLDLLSISNLLSLAGSIQTKFVRVNVKGNFEGLKVEADGVKANVGDIDMVAGGFVGMANSAIIDDCHVTRLRSVKAQMQDGIAGGFVGKSSIGGLIAAGGQVSGVLNVSDLLNTVPYLVPEFNGCHVAYVNNGFVEADCAGGFTGDFQSGFVNKHTTQGDESPYVDEADEYPPFRTRERAVEYIDEYNLANPDATISLPAITASNYSDFVSLLHYQDYKVQAGNVYWPAGKLDCACVDAESGSAGTGTIHTSNCTCYCCAPDRGTYKYGVPENPWSVYNIGYVRGGTYAGGWGGYVHSGALAAAGGGGLSLLDGVGVNLSGLLNLVNAYVPMIMYAGVKTGYDKYNSLSGAMRGFDTRLKDNEENEPAKNNGLAVFAAHVDNPAAPATAGYAGGYIGLGEGIQVSYSDVTYLKTGVIIHPDYLEEVDGSAYMAHENFFYDEESRGFTNSVLDMEYAVAGAYYAGGYIGHMAVGSAASVGDSLTLLGDAIQLTNILDAANAVVSTIEHSDVMGAPGGFDVIACPRINIPDKKYGDQNGLGVGYAGGFAGLMEGGHTQDSNVDNFEYIIGEVAAGGYVGEMKPGSVASVLGENNEDRNAVLDKVVNISSLASLLNDFVPTIRNSQTTCVPCGGAVRAQLPSDTSGNIRRGMAGGYVGHMVGGQIWGFDNRDWRSQDDMSVHAVQDVATDDDGNPYTALVYLTRDGKTVYQLQQNYGSFTQGTYVINDEDPVTHKNEYKSYPGNTDELKVVTREANARRSGLLIPRYHSIEANTYITSLGKTVYQYAHDDYYDGRGETDYSLVTNGGDIGASDYFTITKETNGLWSYQKYVLTGSETVKDANAKVSLVVQETAELMVDQYETDNDENLVLDDNGDPILITKEVPNLHPYGKETIPYLHGETNVIEPQRQCAAIRIRSVYGREYAGGYVGLMEAGSQVDTGNISLLGNLVDASNLLSALSVSYSTIYFGYVNGPMRGGDDIKTDHASYESPQFIGEESFERAQELITWSKFSIWWDHVGQYGGQGFRGKPTEAEFATWAQDYLYGYNVRAGRGSYSVEYDDDPADGYAINSGTALSLSGTAGGFGGSMWSGVVHDSEGVDARNVLAMRAAGGFVGEMQARGLAELGKVGVLGDKIQLNLGTVAQLGQVLVPSIRRSGISGYQSGLTVIANGNLDNHDLDEQKCIGNAGGFVGASYGGQIGMTDEDADEAYYNYHPFNAYRSGVLLGRGATIWVNRLVRVRGTNAAGGFVGKSTSASVLNADLDQATNGALQGLISGLISSPDTLLSALDATVATYKNTVVNALEKNPASGSVERDNYVAQNLQQRYDAYIEAHQAEHNDEPGWPNARQKQEIENDLREQLAEEYETNQESAYVEAELPARYQAYIKAHPDEYPNGYPTAAERRAIEERLRAELREEYRQNREMIHANDDYGIIVEGFQGSAKNGSARYAARLPKYAGGYAGTLEATVVGEHDDSTDNTVVNRLRGVYAREYAGGFFGLADVGSVADVGGNSGTSILNLIQAGNVGVLDAFRTYIYYSEVNGLNDGYRVIATDQDVKAAVLDNYQISGAAGGFGGWMNNGTIEHSFAVKLNYAEAQNYAGGFAGYMGKNKAVDASGVQITDSSPLGKVLSALGLGTGLNLGALNIVGATVTDCGVRGYGEGEDNNIGFDVKTLYKQVPTGTSDLEHITGSCAAGFIGYGDLTQIENCTVERLKKVSSQQIAGGFLGRGTSASLVETSANIALVSELLEIVGWLLLNVLHVDDLSNLNLISLDGITADGFEYLGIKLLSDGYVLMLTLAGIQIGINIGEPDEEGAQHLLVTIGSSTVDLRIDPDGNLLDSNENKEALSVSLFEANRTSVKYCTVSGVIDGYDVHGDGYVEVDADGDGYDDDDSGERNNDDWGYAGGFVGYHKASFFSHNEMLYCDVVAGSKSTTNHGEAGKYTWPLKVGPFTGGFNVNARTGNRNIDYFEGRGAIASNDNQNIYHIYRNVNAHYVNLDGNGTLVGDSDARIPEYMRYNVQHRISGASKHLETYPDDWESMSSSEQAAYLSGYLIDHTDPAPDMPYPSNWDRMTTQAKLDYQAAYARGYNAFSADQNNKYKLYNGVYQFSADTPSPDAGTTYLENAKYIVPNSTDVSDVTLDAWLSDGKAKLMLGRILEENTPHEVLEPLDINDPCDDVELTIVKVWEHGDNTEWQQITQQQFEVFQIITFNPERQLLVNTGGNRSMGIYTLTRAKDLLREEGDAQAAADANTETWQHLYVNPTVNLPGDENDDAYYFYFGKDSLLPLPSGMAQGAHRVFQSTAQNPLYAELKKNADGSPMAVEGTPGDIDLYYKSNNPDRFVAAETVQLYYKDSADKFYPAFSYRVDENNDLEYSDDAFYKATPDEVNGNEQIYYATSQGADGDSFTVTGGKLTAYHYVNQGDGTVINFSLDATGAVTAANQTARQAGPVTSETIQNVSYYKTVEGVYFTFHYNPYTGELEMNYNLDPNGVDGVVREKTESTVKDGKTHTETFGYDANNRLRRYAYRIDNQDILIFAVDPDKTSGSDTPVTLDADKYDGRYVGSSYTVYYRPDSFSVLGNSTTVDGNKRYVATYTAEDQRMLLYYPLEALKYSAYTTALAFERTDGDKVYGMDAYGDVLLFRYRNPDAKTGGFLAELNSDGTIKNAWSVSYTETTQQDPNDPNATVTVLNDTVADVQTPVDAAAITNGGKSVLVDGVRYTLEYNPDTRKITVYQAPELTLGDRVAYYYSKVENTGYPKGTDELWLDENKKPIRLVRTVDGDKLTVDFKADGTPDAATDQTGTGNPVNLTISDPTTKPQTETVYLSSTQDDIVSIDLDNDGTPESLTCYVKRGTGDLYYVTGDAGNRTYYTKTASVYEPLTDQDVEDDLDAYFSGANQHYRKRQVTTTQAITCVVYKNKTTGELVYVYFTQVPNGGDPITMADLYDANGEKLPNYPVPVEWNQISDEYEAVNTTTYCLVDETPDPDKLVALLRSTESAIQVAYRTEALKDSDENTIHSQVHDDKKGGKHIFYYDANGDLVRYELKDKAGKTMTVAITASDLDTAIGANGTTLHTKGMEQNYDTSHTTGYFYPESDPTTRYFLRYVKSQEVEQKKADGTGYEAVEVPVRTFTFSYGLPEDPPVVFKQGINLNSSDVARYDADGNVVGYRHYLQNDVKRERIQTGTYTSSREYVYGVVDFTIDPNTGAVSSATYSRVWFDNGSEKVVSTYTSVTVTDGFFTLPSPNGTSNYVRYDKTTEKIEVMYNAELETVGSKQYLKKVSTDSETGVTCTYRYLLDGTFVSFTLQKGSNTPIVLRPADAIAVSAGTITMDGDNSLSYALLKSGAGADAKYTGVYTANGGKLYSVDEIANFPPQALPSGQAATAADVAILSDMQSKAPDVVMFSYYGRKDESTGKTYRFITGYDAEGNARYIYAEQTYILTEDNLVFEFTLDSTGLVNTVYQSDSGGLDGYLPNTPILSDNKTWSYQNTNGFATIYYRVNAANKGDLRSSTYVASASDIEHTIPASPQHDVDITLPVPDLPHTVAVAGASSYEAVLAYMRETPRETYAIPPDAEVHYQLAKLLGLPEYVRKQMKVYYQYGILEGTLPAHYTQVAFYHDDAHTKATFVNRYENERFQIDLLKYDAKKTDDPLPGAKFRLYRYETGKGLLLTHTPYGVDADGAQERTLLVSGEETVFTVTPSNDKYRFESNGKYLGVNTLGMLSMITETHANGERLDWVLEQGTNGIWNLKNTSGGKTYYLAAETVNGKKTFGLSNSATTADREIKLWILDAAGEKATRGLTGQAIVSGGRVILYNTEKDVALQISVGGFSGLSVVNGVQPTFTGGVDPNTQHKLLFVGSDTVYKIKFNDGTNDKYLAVENNKLVYSSTGYDWTFEFKQSDGLWRIKTSDGKKALSYDPDKSCFVIADYNAADDSASRFLLFGPTPSDFTPLSPLTRVPTEGAIFYAADRVKSYYTGVDTNGAAQFSLIKSQALEKVTGADGMISFPGLDEGLYYLEETEAPDGYALRKEPIEVLVKRTAPNDPDTDKTDDVNMEGPGDEHRIKVKVPNYEDGYKIVVDKFQSGDRSQKLAGATFIAYRYPTDEERQNGLSVGLSEAALAAAWNGVVDPEAEVPYGAAKLTAEVDGDDVYLKTEEGKYLSRSGDALTFSGTAGDDAKWKLAPQGTDAANGWKILTPDEKKALRFDQTFTLAEIDTDNAGEANFRFNLYNADKTKYTAAPTNGDTLSIAYALGEKDRLYYKEVNGETVYTTRLSEATPKTTDENGYAEFSDVAVATHYLRETEAPVDFRRLLMEIRVVVGEENVNQGENLITRPDDMTVVAHVPNIPKSTLPATGAQGAAWMLAASMSLMSLAGAYLLYQALRKRREAEESRQ